MGRLRTTGDRRDQRLRVVLVGSRALDPLALRPALVKLLLALPAGAQILLRLGANIGPQAFEERAWIEAKRLGFEPIWCVPQTGKGRAATYERDIEMVERADLVLGIFPPDQVMEGGTGHVVEKALDQGVPVKAFITDSSGLLPVAEADAPVKQH